jgi:hypothetical protein
MLFDTSGINVIGIGGSRNTIFVSTNNLINFKQGNAGMVLGGITFRSAGVLPTFEFFLQPLTLAGNNYHYDIFYDTGGVTTQQCMLITSSTGTVYGTYRRIYTVGTGMYGFMSSNAFDATCLFEDCECGNVGIGARFTSVIMNNGPFSGTLRRVRYTGANWTIFVGPTAFIDNCRFNGCNMRFVASSSGARIERTTILPASGTCFGTTTDAATIQAIFNTLKTFGGATPFGVNIVNSIATPNNVQSDAAA